MFGIQRDAVIVRAHQRVRADDDVRQIRGRFRPFAMDDEVLTALDRRGIVTVRMKPARVRVKRIGIMHLLVERNPGIGAEQHQTAAGRAVFAGHDVGQLVTRRRGAGVEQALDVNAAFAVVLELEVRVKPFVARDLAERRGDAGENRQVILRIVERFDAALPDLQERIRARGGNFQILELHP